jgi:mono/diheme cytochrome c family protein
MRRARSIQYRCLAIAAATVAVLPGLALAQAPLSADFGRFLYRENCSACHGIGGKGDGPLSGKVDTRAGVDLTLLAKANNGVFPVERAYEIIDGRQEIVAHGSRDMPVWGTTFLERVASEGSVELPWGREFYVRVRVLALVDYLNRLQQR